MVTVNDLLALKAFKKIKLVNEQTGLNRKVSWPNIAQTADISKWLVGGDVIIMTGIGLDLDEKFILDIIRQAVKGKASCLIILTNDDYIKGYSESVVEFATQHEFPLLEAPWETKISNIIRDVSQLVTNDLYEDNLKNIFWQRIISNNIDICDEYCENVITKYSLSGDQTVIIIRNENYENNEKELSFQTFLISQSKIFFANELYIRQERDIIIIIPFEKLESIEVLCQKFMSFIEDKKGKRVVKIGIGDQSKNVNEIYKSYLRAEKTLNMCGDKMICSYKDLGIFQLLLELENQQIIYDYVQEHLKSLFEYDACHGQELVITLQTFLENNGSMTETADKMYIHRNTLLKRIAKIEELLNISLKNALDRNTCYNCLLLIKYIKHAH